MREILAKRTLGRAGDEDCVVRELFREVVMYVMGGARFLACVLSILLGCFLPVSPGWGVDVQRVVSEKGIEAWLLRSEGMPIIAVAFSFQTGSVLDPEGQAGATGFVAELMNEGAGDLDGVKFQTRLDDLAVDLNFRAGRDSFSGAMRTLSMNAEDAFDLLGLALKKPRFDGEAIERRRADVFSEIRMMHNSPVKRAHWRLFERAFGGHPYARPVIGRMDELETVDADDLHALHRRLVRGDRVKIGVAGDIDPERLKVYLDRVFGDLPVGDPDEVRDPVHLISGPWKEAVEMDIPQTFLLFGHEGISYDDPRFYAAQIVNHILGGGIMTSRLYKKVREERGLAYSVTSKLVQLEGAPLFVGVLSTSAESFDEALALVKGEMERMAKEGPTGEELEAAKSALKGRYILRLDTNPSIASELVALQVYGRGVDHFERYADFIDAVTHGQVVDLASHLLRPDQLMIVTAGRGSL